MGLVSVQRPKDSSSCVWFLLHLQVLILNTLLRCLHLKKVHSLGEMLVISLFGCWRQCVEFSWKVQFIGLLMISDIVIVSFDFDNEQFGSVPLPPPFDGIGKNFICRVPVSLGVLGGCLSLTDSTHRGCIDTWVMKEYGVRDSWAKVLSIEEKPELNKRDNDDFQVIKYMENGEILMLKCRQYLVSYDPAKKSIRTIGRTPTCDLEAVAYSPNLFRFEDAMMGYPVHVLHVKLRPTASEIRGSEANDGSTPWCKYWWINEVRATNLRDASEHIGEVLRHAKELLKRAYKINTR